MVALVERSRQGTLGWIDLWAPHNGHRILFPRLVDLVLIDMTGWNRQIEMTFDLALAMATFLLLVWCVYITLDSRRAALALALPFSLLVLSLAQFENWLSPFQIQFFLAIFGVALCLAALAPRSTGPFLFALALAGAEIASLSSLHGLAIWIAFLPLVLRSGYRRSAVWGGAAIATYVAYFAGGTSAGTSIPASFADLLGYSLAYIGAPLGFPDLRQAQFLAAVSICLFLANLVALGLRRQALHVLLLWSGLGLFALGCTALTALGRGGALGIEQALSSRYHAFAALWWVATLAIGWHTASLLSPYFRRDAIGAQDKAWRGMFHLNVAGALLIAPGLLAVNRVGRDSLAIWQDGLRRQQHCVVNYAIAPDNCLQLFHPSPEVVRDGAAFLAQEHLAIFRSIVGSTNGQMVRINGTTPFSIDSVGGIVLNEPHDQPITVAQDRSLVITGWAIDAGNRSTAGEVFVIVDGVGEFRTEYGAGRPDVAALHSRTAYVNSGYTLTLPAGTLAAGKHTLSIRIVTQDQRGYYDPPDKVEIIVR